MATVINGTTRMRGKVSGVTQRRITLNPVGGAGTSVATGAIGGLGPGALVAIAVDYTSQAATTDLTVRADGTGGQALLTLTNVNTDVAAKVLKNAAAVDEGGAAVAATDGVGQGNVYYDGVYFDVAQADDSSTCTKPIIVDIWVVPLTLYRAVLIAQSGADGAGIHQMTIPTRRAGLIQAIAVDYQNTPATADLIIKADSSAGATLFTRTNSNTDLAPSAVGTAAGDEANAATAATDSGGFGGFPYQRGLYFDLAQTDAFTQGDEKTIVDVWAAEF